jgi:hypothetical protein
MVEPKKINLGRFFSEDSSTPSGISVRGISLPNQPLIVSSSDLSNVISIIKTDTQITKEQQNSIIEEDRRDRELEGLVKILQGRILSLQSGLKTLNTQFQNDLLLRNKQYKRKKFDELRQKIEDNKVSSSTPLQSIVSLSSDNQPNFGMQNAQIGMIGGIAASAGILAAMLPKEGESSGGATGSAKQWKPLLDVIASGEGSWESMNPGKTLSGATKMTIKEVDSKATGAVGRYQFTSLMSQAKAAGLNPEKDLFSPENQDKIAVDIIENKRGGKSWANGKTKDDDFINLLSQEWAALKNKSGKGYYDGKNGNKASVDYSKTLNALKSIKQGLASDKTAEPVKQSSESKLSSTPEKEKPPSGQQVSSVDGAKSPPSNLIAMTPSESGGGNNPVIIAANGGGKQMPSQVEISSGGAIPGGYTKNFSNWYSDVTQSVYGIMA